MPRNHKSNPRCLVGGMLRHGIEHLTERQQVKNTRCIDSGDPDGGASAEPAGRAQPSQIRRAAPPREPSWEPNLVDAPPLANRRRRNSRRDLESRTDPDALEWMVDNDGSVGSAPGPVHVQSLGAPRNT